MNKTIGMMLCAAALAHGGEPSATPVAFDAALKGRRVSVTVEVENTGAYAVGNKLELRQFDAAGRRLMEDVCDPRFLTFMRPAGRRHAMTVEGSIHPKTEKITLVSAVYGARPAWMTCADADVKVHGVKVSAAPERRANEAFFTDGVEGRALDLHGSRAFFFPVYSRVCWGQGLEVTDPESLFFPVREGTVEAWIRPEWGEGPCTLFDAANLAPGAANAKNAKGSLFAVTYDPAKRALSFVLKGDDGKTFSGKGTCDLAPGAWHHVAVTFAPGGEAAAFADGKKVASASLAGYVPPNAGVQSSGPMLFAFGGGAKRIREATRRDIPVFAGALDNLRLSSVVRYGGDFVPERAFGQDAQTRALFRFEGEIDGTSAGADGIVEASIRADEALYPGDAKPKFEKAMPFDVLNYREVPSEKDYLSLVKTRSRTFRLSPGESAKMRLPEDAAPDFTEIANNGEEDLVAPLVLHPGEVDPRSYETIRATAGLAGLTDRQKADRLFQYAVRSMDYFGCHQANAGKGASWTFAANNAPLRNLNVYGADICGGLNKVAANLFTLCGDLPANTVQGYGHEFEHVLLGGKARVYDLSNQQHFDSLADDGPASLQEIDREPSAHVRYAKSADHFTRLFRHAPWYSRPDYGPRFFLTLKPGERFRWWRRNDGGVNDVWCAKKGKAAPLAHPLVAPAPAECRIDGAYLVNRFTPDPANGFVYYEGRAPEKAYAVDFAYTVVRGEYRAEGADGKPRAVELSRDLGKTWKEMPADADGTVRLDYAVRGLHHYVVRAKGGEPSRFRATTELQMNPRVLTGLARGGENEFLLTAQTGGAADVTVAWREAAGPIKVSGAAFAGGVRGAERLLAAVDPAAGPTALAVEGVAEAVVEKGALDAELKDGRLVLSARGGAEKPFYGLVTLRGADPAAKRSLSVLVGRGARLAFAGDGMEGRMLEKSGERATLRFAPTGPGRFMVYNLTRVPGGLPHTRVGARPLAQVVAPKERSPRRRLLPCAGTRGAADWFKAATGAPGGRAAYHWDCAQDPATRYAMGAPLVLGGEGLDHVDFEMTADYPGGIELFAAAVVPEGDHAFQGETIKMFSGLSYDPALSLGGGYRVLPAKKSASYAKVEPLAPVGLSLKDGVMCKDGRPHFWIGNGDGDAASQQGHFGVWLAWLQGADAVTLNHGMKVNARRAPDGAVEVWDEPDFAIQSWRREAARLGLLCDFFHSHEPGTGGQTCTAEAYRLSLEDPDLHEIYYHLGHHLGFDTGSDEGLAFSLAHRKALFDYLEQEPNTSYMEIAREPGANPSNKRVRRGFVEWARRKYGGDLAAADAVWGVKHGSWDEVVPPHLDKTRFPAKHSYEDILVRNRARAEAPNFYADWRRFLEDDTTRMMERELSALRRLAPWAPSTVDVRGHTNRDDGYAAFVPERISPLVDLFSIHYGTKFYDYGGRPWERSCVLQASDAPLMWESYFRVNTDGAIVNSENIFGDARSAMQSEEQMRANDMGKLCAQRWRIAKDAGWEASRKWKEPDFDDSSWDEIAVPGCWDQASGTAYEGFQGTCWLRRTFDVSGARKQDFVDGSCVFKLIGKGVAQQGDVWLNGHKLNKRKVAGWSAPYAFDVGPFLNWGGRNVLVWRVEGMGRSDNGLRFPSYILTQDQLAKPVPFDERMCRFMLFGHLAGGLSGNWMWHWHDDGVRAYLPRVKAQLNAVAEATLPALRRRRGRVACLYAYDNGPGLPFGEDARHYVDYHDALVFCGADPDVFGEERFRRDVTPERYPVLLVPMTSCVDASTYAHFKRYVAAGGTAVVTDGTFLRTRERYAGTDFAEWLEKGDFGKGRVLALSSRAELGELIDRLADVLPPPEVRVESRTPGEKPLIQRLLVGGRDVKALYLANWGGLRQELSVTLPGEYAGWELKPVAGAFGAAPARAGGPLSVTVDPQDVAAALLVRPGAKAPEFPKVSPRRQARLDALAAWRARAESVPCGSADVVFVSSPGGLRRGGRAQGIEKHPEILRALDRLGLTYAETSATALKEGDLAAAKLAILPESNSNCGVKQDGNAKGPMAGILEAFVRRGGSLMVLADSAGSRNCDALSLRELAGRFGVSAAREAARDEARGSFGDPFQILSADVPQSPLSDGVGAVQLYRLRPLAAVPAKKRPRDVAAFPVVNVKGGAAVMAGTCGKGKFLISSDISMFAPLRIEHGDNAGLLANALGWLLGRPADAAAREACRKGLFLTEADFRAIMEDERRER